MPFTCIPKGITLIVTSHKLHDLASSNKNVLFSYLYSLNYCKHTMTLYVFRSGIMCSRDSDDFIWALSNSDPTVPKALCICFLFIMLF